MPMKRIYFEPGQEPVVVTSVSHQCADGKCEECRGIFYRDDYPGQAIICVHPCHMKRNQGNQFLERSAGVEPASWQWYCPALTLEL
jgi:hypothetical protein